jgi:hypothetical protein
MLCVRAGHLRRDRGELAQLGERRPCKAEVTGSNPVFSTMEVMGRFDFAARSYEVDITFFVL